MTEIIENLEEPQNIETKAAPNPKLVAIVGRTNVGKSSLFNRLTGKKFALVANEHGVTRDVQVKPAQLGDLHFMCADTAGLQSRTGDKEEKMRNFAYECAEKADVILFMIDGQTPLSSEDHAIARHIRKLAGAKVLLINKAENHHKIADNLPEFSRLGFNNSIEMSASHGDGFIELYDILRENLESDGQLANFESIQGEKPLSFAIIGRPNVGKSSLVNKLLREIKVLAGEEAGLTRDATHHRFYHLDRLMEVIDTAGIRKKNSVEDGLEYESVGLSMQALKYANTGIIMVDARYGLEKQDLILANRILAEGRSFLIALNKWDLVPNQAEVLAECKARLLYVLPQVKQVPVVPISALTGQGINKLLDAIIESDNAWNTRIPTHLLNQWLRATTESHPHNSIKGLKPKFRYMTQIKSRPPHFVFFVSRKNLIEDSYLGYLENRIREAFDFKGSPIRFTLRAGKNPYATNEKEK